MFYRYYYIHPIRLLIVVYLLSCFFTAIKLIKVRIGGYNTDKDLDFESLSEITHQDFEIDETLIHPEYSFTTMHHDIALIR